MPFADLNSKKAKLSQKKAKMKWYWLNGGRKKSISYGKEWKKKNPQKVREYKKTSYLRHREKILEKRRIYVKNNIEKIRLNAAEHRMRNREFYILKGRERYKKNRRLFCEIARLKNLGIPMTLQTKEMRILMRVFMNAEKGIVLTEKEKKEKARERAREFARKWRKEHPGYYKQFKSTKNRRKKNGYLRDSERHSKSSGKRTSKRVLQNIS